MRDEWLLDVAALIAAGTRAALGAAFVAGFGASAVLFVFLVLHDVTKLNGETMVSAPLFEKRRAKWIGVCYAVKKYSVGRWAGEIFHRGGIFWGHFLIFRQATDNKNLLHYKRIF